MKNILVLTITFFALQTQAQAQKQKHQQDQEAIKSMCGCYEVGFNFSETFAYNTDSTYVPSPNKNEKALEWVELVEDSDNKLVLQHLLIVGAPDNQMIIKHWRQDWMFENSKFYMYSGDNVWDFAQKSSDEVKGQWSQKVYQVDDSPRYEGSATWVHVDGKSFWENTTNAPLPRREYTQRSDYNITVRRNRHEITKDGWIHVQDNDKVLREEGNMDQVIAQEKGYNTYVRIPNSKCAKAQMWWKENEAFWKEARTAWEAVFSFEKKLALADKIDGKHLHEVLFAMDVQTTKSKKIEKSITSFIK